jgi:hypothetical protein
MVTIKRKNQVFCKAERWIPFDGFRNLWEMTETHSVIDQCGRLMNTPGIRLCFHRLTILFTALLVSGDCFISNLCVS